MRQCEITNFKSLNINEALAGKCFSSRKKKRDCFGNLGFWRNEASKITRDPPIRESLSTFAHVVTLNVLKKTENFRLALNYCDSFALFYYIKHTFVVLTFPHKMFSHKTTTLLIPFHVAKIITNTSERVFTISAHKCSYKCKQKYNVSRDGVSMLWHLLNYEDMKCIQIDFNNRASTWELYNCKWDNLFLPGSR